MTAPRFGAGGVCLLGAVTIERFEVSRWRGGCGTVFATSRGCAETVAVFGKRREDGVTGRERGDEVEYRQ
jgi:hypothetical protein